MDFKYFRNIYDFVGTKNIICLISFDYTFCLAAPNPSFFLGITKKYVNV